MAFVINLIITILAVIVNGFVALSFFTLLNYFYPIDFAFLNEFIGSFFTIKPAHAPYIEAGIVMISLTLLSFTPITDIILRFTHGFRSPLREEKEKLHRLFAEVCHSAKKNPDNYKLYIADENVPNAYALGINTIGVGRRLLMDYSAAEIKGVIAHEIGHLHYGDTIYNRIFITVSLVGQAVLAVYYFIGKLLVIFARIPIPFVNLAALFIGFAFTVQSWLFEILLALSLSIGKMLGCRQSEYRADRYALEIGHGEGLYQFLYRLLDSHPGHNNGLKNILHASHPKTGNRLRKLEEYNQSCTHARAEAVVMEVLS